MVVAARQGEGRRLRVTWSQLVAAASERLNHDGVSPDWFGAVANDLGVTRPALYSYVRDRDDLQVACYTATLDRYEAALSAALADNPPADAVVAAFVSAATDRATGPFAVIAERDALAPEARGALDRRYDALVQRLADILRRGIHEGSIRPLEPDLVALAVVAIVEWGQLGRRWRSGEFSTSFREAACLVLADGIATAVEPSAIVRLDLDFHDDEPLDPFDREAIERSRRRFLLVRASRRFNRCGVGATRIEDVAEDLGISKRAVFQYTAGKADLLGDCLDRAFDIYDAIGEAIARAPVKRDAAMMAAYRHIARLIADPAHSLMLPAVGVGLLPRERQAGFRLRGSRLAAAYRAILVAGQLEGTIRKVPAEALVDAGPGLFWWVAHSLPAEWAERLDQVADELAALAMCGIRAATRA